MIDSSKALDAIPPAAAQHHSEQAICNISLRRRLRRGMWHFLARLCTLLCVVALKISCLIGRKRRPIPDTGCEIMLTGRFDSKNWIQNHLGPLAASEQCSLLWMVSAHPVPELPGVRAIYTPKWLMRIVGMTPARLLTFLFAAMRKRPHIVGGFHLTFNGVASVIVARLMGARSMYFCVGGPTEVHNGGVDTVESPFRKMETPDRVVEKRLLEVIAASDLIITMGTRAKTFFHDEGIASSIHVMAGGIDSARFRVAEEPPPCDVILTGRLVEIKRIDVFLKAIEIVKDTIPNVRAAIVGDGQLRDELQSLSETLGTDGHVRFAGHQDNIELWLRQSKIFALTSDSEGLSLSLMEAMMSGLPAVVSDVGDLGDLVENGANGYLVTPGAPELFAARIVELLRDDAKLAALSQAARCSAMRYDTSVTIERWNRIIADCRITPEKI